MGSSAAALIKIMKYIEKLPVCLLVRYHRPMEVESSGTPQPIRWMSTRDACERLGVTLRTLYRFIDEGQLPAYKMGRVIRLQSSDIESFIGRMRIEPGTLEHLYPEPKGHDRPASDEGATTGADGGALEEVDIEERAEAESVDIDV
jgi:excisionase family DNA binding protein